MMHTWMSSILAFISERNDRYLIYAKFASLILKIACFFSRCNIDGQGGVLKQTVLYILNEFGIAKK